MGLLSIGEKIQLQTILEKSSYLQTADDRKNSLEVCGLAEYCDLRLDQSSGKFARDLLVQLSKIECPVKNFQRNGLIVFLEYLYAVDHSLSTEDKEIIKQVINNWKLEEVKFTSQAQKKSIEVDEYLALISKMRTLKASLNGIELAEQSLKNIPSVKKAIEETISKCEAEENLKYQEAKRRGETYEQKDCQNFVKLTDKIKPLAKQMKYHESRLLDFFQGKEIARTDFISICDHLKQDLREIIDRDFVEVVVELIPKLRFQLYSKIKHHCSTLNILYVERSIELTNLYIDVNILEKPNSYQWLEKSDFPQVYNRKTEEFERLSLGKVVQSRVPGLDVVTKYSKLMVLGKPGSGKSTFLKHIAIECNENRFQAERVPIFIQLKKFAEDAKKARDFSLLRYISQEFDICSFAQLLVIEKVLKYGKAIILLDGLDEVLGDDGDEVVKPIRNFCDKYSENKFIITCRTAAKTFEFTQFTYVEIADFNQEQIEKFAKKWFIVVEKNSENEGKANAASFIEKLNLKENEPIREIAITPILLSLVCLVFQAKDNFPSNRSMLYEEGLEILLIKWDESKGIKRDEIYRKLSIENKIKMLTQVATITFENGDYFFEQNKVQKIISDYLFTLPDAQTYSAKDSEAVLRAIELQHGLLIERARRIYSFSHLTFQEYFTAKAIINSFDPQKSYPSLKHIKNRNWREVFLLATSSVDDADNFLKSMKEQIDALLASDVKLQQLLSWLNKKSLSLEITCEAVAVRAFYFAHIRNLVLNIYSIFDLKLDLELASMLTNTGRLNSNHAIQLDLSLADLLHHVYDLDSELNISLADAYEFSLFFKSAIKTIQALNITLAPQLNRCFQEIKTKIANNEKFAEWWEANGQAWAAKLRQVVIDNYHIGYDWCLNSQQIKLINQYYYANKLLVDCLNSGCNVTPQVRQEIEATLLLPTLEIETKTKRQHKTIKKFFKICEIFNLPRK